MTGIGPSSNHRHASHDRPKIVMLVANRFTHDTRVYKEARSLIEWGCEVHIVALAGGASESLPFEEVQDEIHIHRVPMGIRRTIGLWLLPGVLVLNRSKGFLRWCLRRRAFIIQPEELLPLSATLLVHDDLQAVRRKRYRKRRWWRRAMPAVMRRLKWARSVLAKIRFLRRKAINAFRRFIVRPCRIIWKRDIVATGRKSKRFVTGQFKRLTPPSVVLLQANFRFANRALDLEPDAVLTHDCNTLLAGLIVKRLRTVPLVYDSHELFLERNIGDKSRVKDRLVWGPVERTGIRACDAVLSVAQGICDHLEKQYSIPKPHLVRNVQPWEPPPVHRTRLLHDELSIPADRRIVIYAGAVTINRGLEKMIEAAEHLKTCVFVVMGYANNAMYLESLVQMARSRGVLGSTLFFRDAVPIDRVVEYVAAADLSIVPTQNVCLSYYFESSNKIFHSLMAGVPLVMSDHVEKRLIVEQYGVGRLFNELDANDVARVTEESLSDQAEYQAMRQNCIEAANTLNWEHEEHTLRSVFASLLGDRARPVPEPRLTDDSGPDSDLEPNHPDWSAAAS